MQSIGYVVDYQVSHLLNSKHGFLYFVHLLAVCGFAIVRCSSMQIPRNLTDVSMQLLPILFNGVSFMNTFILSKSHRMCFCLITIYLVLFAFSDNLFAQNHWYNLFISLFAVSNKYTKLWSDICRVVSSARERILLSHDLWISLTYSKYNKGPKIDP